MEFVPGPEYVLVHLVSRAIVVKKPLVIFHVSMEEDVLDQMFARVLMATQERCVKQLAALGAAIIEARASGQMFVLV